MTRVKTQANRPETLHEPGLHGRFDGRARSPVAAAGPRWLGLCIAAALGVVAGTTLFPTEAKGRRPGLTDRPPRRASA